MRGRTWSACAATEVVPSAATCQQHSEVHDAAEDQQATGPIRHTLDAPHVSPSAGDGRDPERAAELGSAMPTAMIQTKPGKRVNGTKGRAPGTMMYSQLSSPQIATAIPSTTTHFGMSLRNAAGMVTPATSRPNGTENPAPPKPCVSQ